MVSFQSSSQKVFSEEGELLYDLVMSKMKVEWHQLKNLAVNNFNKISDDSGIYFVRWARSGKPVCVSRLVGSDDNGILYVGKAKKLKRKDTSQYASPRGRIA